MLASRVLGTAVIGVIVVVPPALALAVQAVCTWLAAANAGYCATPVSGMLGRRSEVKGRMASRACELGAVPAPLVTRVLPCAAPTSPPPRPLVTSKQMLADPLTRGRVAAAVGALDLLSLPLSVVAPQPEQTGARALPLGDALGCAARYAPPRQPAPLNHHAVRLPPAADPAAACSAFIFLLQLTVGVAAPLLFLARTEWKEPSLAPPPPSPPPQSTNASGQPKWKGLRLRAARAAAAANWAVWRCCSLPGSTSLLALWLGLSAAWTAALLRYGI